MEHTQKAAEVDDPVPYDRTETVTVATIYYPADFPMMLLQARSFRLLLVKSSAIRFIVVDNGPTTGSSRRLARLRAAYGVLAAQAIFLHATDLGAEHLEGYRRQQALKLEIAHAVKTEFYILLDAKDHLRRSTTSEELRGSLFDKRGRIRTTERSYVGHPHRAGVAASADFMGINLDESTTTSPNTTPFVMETRLAVELSHYIQRRAGKSVYAAFRDLPILEFPLYSLYSKHIEPYWKERHVLGNETWPKVWPDDVSERRVVEVFDRSSLPIVAVHPRALRKIRTPALQRLISHWVEQGLFKNRPTARLFVVFFRLKSYYWRGTNRLQSYRPVLVRRDKSTPHDFA